MACWSASVWVVVTRAPGGRWAARCLDFDVTRAGATAQVAVDALGWALARLVDDDRRLHRGPWGRARAPDVVWEQRDRICTLGALVQRTTLPAAATAMALCVRIARSKEGWLCRGQAHPFTVLAAWAAKAHPTRGA